MKTMTALVTGLAVLGPFQARASGENPAGDAGDGAVPRSAGQAEGVAGAECFDYAQVWDRVAGMAESLIEVEGSAVVIRPDGQRQEHRFGQEKRIRLKNGGVKVELRLAPDRNVWDQYIHDFVVLFHERGPDAAVIEKALDGIRQIDDFGALQIRGLVIEPGGAKHDFVFGNAANDTPKRFAAKMQDGGVVANLRMAPGEAAVALLGLAAVQSEIGKPRGNEAQESKSAGPPLAQALSDPDTLKLLRQGLQDPAIQGMINEGLSDPETRKLAEAALQSDLAQGLLNQFLPGAAARPAKPKAVAEPSEDPRDAEIRELKLEIERQRLMLEKILEKLEPK